MNPKSTGLPSPKNFRNHFPRLSKAIREFVILNYESVSDFPDKAGIPRSRYYALLRSDDKGAMPRFDLVTTILNLAFITSDEAYSKLYLAMLGDMGWQCAKKGAV